MYKDKGNQREANKQAQIKRRQGMTEGMTKTEGMTGCDTTIRQAAKLKMVCDALDHDITGLGGKVNMLDLVRYGSISMRDVKAQLI